MPRPAQSATRATRAMAQTKSSKAVLFLDRQHRSGQCESGFVAGEPRGWAAAGTQCYIVTLNKDNNASQTMRGAATGAPRINPRDYFPVSGAGILNPCGGVSPARFCTNQSQRRRITYGVSLP